jgi:diketogulonate reductase-like aldo/keto reductase
MSDASDERNVDRGRRRLLRWGALGAGLAALPWRWALAEAVGGSVTDIPMRERAIPATGERVPVMGLGSSGSFSTGDATKFPGLREVLRRFAELGGRLLDTSPTYGDAETNIGRMARELDVRDELFMATKVNAPSRTAGIDQMARSRRLLGEPIDLMQVHNLVALKAQWPTLKRIKEEGRVRYIGFTHYRVGAFGDLERYMKELKPDFVQFNYSVVTTEAEQRLLPLAEDKGIAVLINRAFEDGRLFRAVRRQPLPGWAADFGAASWAQFFLKYVIAHPVVTCVIPATSDPVHLVDNMSAGTGRFPDARSRLFMRQHMASL